MINLTSETLVKVPDSPQLFPGQPPHISTVWRWISKGVDGVTLESVRVGGLRYTTKEAISRFIAAQNAEVAQ